MVQCPKCSAQVPAESKFCLSCGQLLSTPSQMPTAEVSPAEPPKAQLETPHVARIISSDSIPAGGFTPGTILADRYRVIGLLGRGGMGEVYRADDLKLGQPVALKFLPKALAEDSVRRERLFAEVRIARQVSHPNICRVYDISEIEGRHFLTMEYIDGEDLASLLKRIGSLHGPKALDVARQMCAGLAAAHDKGVLHRDLKPANVMIDGRGHVRITDFGLAVAAGEDVPEADVSGTPPYMAPEQFAGKGASVRSDIYALGLVFYEVFTGRRAFEAKTLAELRAKKETSSPTAPSEIARDIDPIVERVILRCIEKDPRQRPASAAQIAAALPGGDPLAAAIAAGETPSPEMVAASGGTEGIRPWIAWTCLAFIVLGIFAAVVLKRQTDLFHRVPVEKPPDVLAEKAREILESAGYPDPPADHASGFTANASYFQYVEKNDFSPGRFEKLPAFAVQFWYRQSPQILEHLVVSVWEEGVTLSDPPFINGGESIVWLDSRGNLIGLQAIPREENKASDAFAQTDWSPLFKASGLNQVEFEAAEPDWTYLAYADVRKAWTGAMPDFPDLRLRIDAAAWQGKPLFWRLTIPAWKSLTIHSSTSLGSQWAMDSRIKFRLALICLAFVIGLIFARRNLRMGRGDRRGAIRLAVFLFMIFGIAWLFDEHHVATLNEPVLIIGYAALGLLLAAISWSLYIALEPFVRRHFPGWLVGWSRLLAGNFRDPLVGRDLLIGCILGIVLVLLNYLRYPLFYFLGAPQIKPSAPILPFLAFAGMGRSGYLFLFSGAHALLTSVAAIAAGSIAIGLAFSFFTFLSHALLKRTWIAVVAVILWGTVVNVLGDKPSLLVLTLIIPAVGIILFALFRFGLLVFIVSVFFYCILLSFPITTHLSAWYSRIGLAGLALLLAMTLYGFHTSLGGQPIFGRASLED
jgi:predicted Ser/Thr protein kinase